eukprot:10726169-Karenia_brevis.AAC.1
MICRLTRPPFASIAVHPIGPGDLRTSQETPPSCNIPCKQVGHDKDDDHMASDDVTMITTMMMTMVLMMMSSNTIKTTHQSRPPRLETPPALDPSTSPA